MSGSSLRPGIGRESPLPSTAQTAGAAAAVGSLTYGVSLALLIGAVTAILRNRHGGNGRGAVHSPGLMIGFTVVES